MNVSTRILMNVVGVAGLLGSGIAIAAMPAGDAAKGKAVFARCSMCHSPEADVNRLGPSLASIVNQKAGKVSGFRYSSALTGSNIIWTRDNLNKFLISPRAMVPGTTMTFSGLPNPADRADVIAYLATLTKQ